MGENDIELVYKLNTIKLWLVECDEKLILVEYFTKLEIQRWFLLMDDGSYTCNYLEQNKNPGIWRDALSFSSVSLSKP